MAADNFAAFARCGTDDGEDFRLGRIAGRVGMDHADPHAVKTIREWVFSEEAESYFEEFCRYFLHNDARDAMDRVRSATQGLNSYFDDHEQERAVEWINGREVMDKFHWSPEDHVLRFSVPYALFTVEQVEHNVKPDWRLIEQDAGPQDYLSVLFLWVRRWVKSQRRYSSSDDSDAEEAPLTDEQLCAMDIALEAQEERRLDFMLGVRLQRRRSLQLEESDSESTEDVPRVPARMAVARQPLSSSETEVESVDREDHEAWWDADDAPSVD